MTPEVNCKRNSKRVIRDRSNLKDVMEHVLLDKTETDLKVDVKKIGHKNDMEKDAVLCIQMKLGY